MSFHGQRNKGDALLVGNLPPACGWNKKLNTSTLTVIQLINVLKFDKSSSHVMTTSIILSLCRCLLESGLRMMVVFFRSTSRWVIPPDTLTDGGLHRLNCPKQITNANQVPTIAMWFYGILLSSWVNVILLVSSLSCLGRCRCRLRSLLRGHH